MPTDESNPPMSSDHPLPVEPNAVTRHFHVDELVLVGKDDTPLPPIKSGQRGSLSPDVIQIPRYEILEELGRGSYGVVYLARQLPLQRLVALKVLRSINVGDPNDRARFFMEANIIASLQHPTIVQLYEFGKHQDTPFFAMEYIRGGSLHDKIAHKPQPPQECALLIRDVALAIQFAHQHQVIHRDLKPGNILLTPEGKPKIVDFGLAKYGNTHMTASGFLVGTLQYLAPEQTTGNAAEITARTDIYALGSILYEMLTGMPVVDGMAPADIIDKVRHRLPEPPCKLHPSIPKDLETICLKCLHKEPERRYATAQELADDLDRFLHEVPVEAQQVAPLEELWFWVRRNRKFSIFATVGFALLLLTMLASIGLAIHAYNRAAEAERLRQQETGLIEDLRIKNQTLQELRVELLQQTQQSATAKDLAEKSKQLAEKQLQQAEELLYIRCLTNAQREWERHRFGKALHALQDTVWDRRHWAFDYLYAEMLRDHLALRRVRSGIEHLVACSPDGKTFAAVSEKGELLVWEARTGHLCWESKLCLAMHPNERPNRLHFTKDGSHLLCTTTSGYFQLWSVAHGVKKQCLDLLEDSTILGSTLLLDGIHMVVLQPQRAVQIHLQTQSIVRSWPFPVEDASFYLLEPLEQNRFGVVHSRTGTIHWCFFDNRPKEQTELIVPIPNTKAWLHPSGRSIALMQQETVTVCSLPDGKLLYRLLLPGVKPVQAVYSPNGSVLAVSCSDGTIRLHGSQDGQEWTILKGNLYPATSLAFHPLGNILLAGSRDGVVLHYLNLPMQPIRRANRPTILHSRFDSSSESIFCIDEQGELFTQTICGRYQKQLAVIQPGWISQARFSHDLQTVVLVRPDQTIQRVRCSDGKILETSVSDLPVQILQFTPDDSDILVGTSQGVDRWRPGLAQRMPMWSTEDVEIRSLHYLSNSGDLLVSVLEKNQGKTLRVDGNTGKVLQTYHHELAPGGVRADGRYAALVDPKGRLFVVHLENQNNVLELFGEEAKIQAVAFHPLMDYLVTSNHSGELHLWDLQNRQQVLSFGDPSLIPTCMEFSPDGRTLLTRNSTSFRCYRAEELPPMYVLESVPTPIEKIAFIPDSPFLAGQSKDVIVVWSLRDGKQQKDQILPPNLLFATRATSADGCWQATVQEGQVHLVDPCADLQATRYTLNKLDEWHRDRSDWLHQQIQLAFQHRDPFALWMHLKAFTRLLSNR